MFAPNSSFLLLKKKVLLCIIAIVLETSSISPKLILSKCCIILTTPSGSRAFWSNAHGWGAGGGLEPTSGSQLSLSAQLCPVKPPSHSPTPGKSLSGKVFQVQNLGRRSFPEGSPRPPGNGCLSLPHRARVLDGRPWEKLGPGGGLADTATRAISGVLGTFVTPTPTPPPRLGLAASSRALEGLGGWRSLQCRGLFTPPRPDCSLGLQPLGLLCPPLISARLPEPPLEPRIQPQARGGFQILTEATASLWFSP